MTACAPVRFCLFFTLSPCYIGVLSSFILDQHFSMVAPGRKKYTAQYYLVWHYDNTKTSSVVYKFLRSSTGYSTSFLERIEILQHHCGEEVIVFDAFVRLLAEFTPHVSVLNELECMLRTRFCVIR